MPRQLYRSKKDLKRESEELALTERRVALTERRVLLALAALLAVTSVVGQFFGVDPATTGIGAGLSALGGCLRR
jgi:hypothetical protein